MKKMLFASTGLMAAAIAFDHRERSGWEAKDDNSAPPASEAKAAVEKVMTAFEEFKKTNDTRLKELETLGKADILHEEKLARINKVLDDHEALSQKAALAEKTSKALDELKTQFDHIETLLSRTNTNGDDKKADRVNLWVKSVVDAYVNGAASLGADATKLLNDVTNEYKALSITPDTAGGYLAPSEFVREIIKAETEMSPVRSLARVRTTGSKSIEVPKRTGQFAAMMVGEMTSRGETEGLAYGMIEIATDEMVAIVDLTNWMLEDSAFDMNSEISMEASEQFAVKEGQLFVSGTGVGQPEGFLTNGDVGFTASGSATSIADGTGQADGLLTLKHSLKTAYARNSTWLLNRTTLGSVRKLKTGDDQYLWMPGIALGKPNTIDGDPYVEMPDMPSEAAGAFPIAYGDFRRAYTWVDRLAMTMLRDPYTQAGTGKVRMWMRKRIGGQVVLAEAIRKLKCST